MTLKAGDPYGLCTRQEAERIEQQLLHPSAAYSSRAWERPQPEAADPFRTCFVRDRDRVLHGGAFRRLKAKTQVFVVDRDDFYRTRLTHTLEVAQLARFLARALRLNESLVEVLALVHDIGHPPFGHEGERILASATGVHFDHNLQALRIVDVLESPYPDRRGLNLTHLTRRMVLKHGGDAGWGTTPTLGHVLEAQITDLADSTAYQHHDLEDALRSGVLVVTELHELSIWRQAAEEAGDVPEGPRGTKAVLNRMLKASLMDLIESSAERLSALGPVSSEEIEQRRHEPIGFSPGRQQQHTELMRFLYERFYRSETVLASRAVAEHALTAIVQHYNGHPGELPSTYKKRIDDEGLPRTVCDYVAGMTDRYALDEWRRLGSRTLSSAGNGGKRTGGGHSGNAAGAAAGVVPTAAPGATTPATPTAEPIAEPGIVMDALLSQSVATLSARIGYTFADPLLAAMALTHASARADGRLPNERLEFLGDAVLGMVVARECYQRLPQHAEGELSRVKATTVNRHALGAVAEAWQLLPLLHLGPGFRDQADVPRSVVADAVEAVLGAVYLDGGLEAVSDLIVTTFGARIDMAEGGRRSRNAKSELQTFTQGFLSMTPNYRLLSETGPDHSKQFTVAAMLGEREVAVGTGRNKRQAEQRAAQQALTALELECQDSTPSAAPMQHDPHLDLGEDLDG